MIGYQLASEAAPARWVVDRIGEFGVDVRSVTPAGFEAYARLFHPAYLDGREVSWREVAEANGRVAHPGMQWPSITGSLRFHSRDDQPGLWDQPPDEGTLPTGPAQRLSAELARHTSTPDTCWYAVWDGFGGVPVPAGAARFEIPGRGMFLLRGTVATIAEAPPLDGWEQRPNLWWPDDRAWCVATEIDFMTTYVGGSAAAIAGLLAVPGLEICEVDPGTGIGFDGDTLNPRPAR